MCSASAALTAGLLPRCDPPVASVRSVLATHFGGTHCARPARLAVAMTAFASSARFIAAAFACGAVAGCSMLRHDTRPATAAAPAPMVAPSATAHAPAPVPQPAAAPASNWDPAVFHLEPAALVGQTWIFPSSSPVRYGDDRFVFKRDRVEASNARDHATGTWTVEADKLCVTLKTGAWGSACYVVTGSPAAGLQIRVLPDGERLPLKIE